MYFLKRILYIFSGILLTYGLWQGPALADEQKIGKNDIEKVVNVAKDHFLKVGKDQAFKDFMDPNNKEFRKGSTYIFVFDLTGQCYAHIQAGIVGTNLMDMKDPNGATPIKNLITVATGNPQGGWSEYMWKNPITNKIEKKISFSLKVGDYVFGAGIYESDLQ